MFQFRHGARPWLIALALGAAMPSAFAEDKDPIWIANSTDCGRWAKARDVHGSPILEAYLVGTLNGLAFGTGIDFWHANGVEISTDAAFLWMDKFCREHPLDLMLAGTIQLFSERTSWKASDR